jgi:hypothetical protein
MRASHTPPLDSTSDDGGGGPSLTVFLLPADAAERTNAEQQLAHAAEVDFVCELHRSWFSRFSHAPLLPGSFLLEPPRLTLFV